MGIRWSSLTTEERQEIMAYMSTELVKLSEEGKRCLWNVFKSKYIRDKPRHHKKQADPELPFNQENK